MTLNDADLVKRVRQGCGACPIGPPLLQNYPHWNTLPAVLNGRVYAVDGSVYFSHPGPRIVDSLELLADILHPKAFSSLAPQEWLPEQVVRLELAGRETLQSALPEGR